MKLRVQAAVSVLLSGARAKCRDDRGSVVETAIIAAGVAVLAIAVIGAIATLVNGQLPDISAP